MQKYEHNKKISNPLPVLPNFDGLVTIYNTQIKYSLNFNITQKKIHNDKRTTEQILLLKIHTSSNTTERSYYETEG